MRITKEELLKTDYLPVHLKGKMPPSKNKKQKNERFVVYDMNAHPLARIWKSRNANMTYIKIKNCYYFLIPDFEDNEEKYSPDYFISIIFYLRNTSSFSLNYLARLGFFFAFFSMIIFMFRYLLGTNLLSDTFTGDLIIFTLLFVAAISFTNFYIHASESKRLNKFLDKRKED